MLLPPTHARPAPMEEPRQIQPSHVMPALRAPIKNSAKPLRTRVKLARLDKPQYRPMTCVKFAFKDCTKNSLPPQHTIASHVCQVLLQTVAPSLVHRAFLANTNICLKRQRTIAKVVHLASQQQMLYPIASNALKASTKTWQKQAPTIVKHVQSVWHPPRLPLVVRHVSMENIKN